MGVFGASIDRIKRRWPLIIVGLAIMLAAAVPLGLALRVPGSQAMAALLRDPLAVLGQRSPGARPKGALYQTKHRRAANGRRRPGATPGERVLSETRYRPDAPIFPVPGVAPEATPGAVAGDLFAADVGQAPVADVPGVAFSPFIGGGVGGGGVVGVIAGGGSGGVGGGGSGGGSTGGGVTTQPTTGTEPTPPAAAVPEPATWLMMIAGFALAGASLRRPARGQRVTSRATRLSA